MAWPLERSLVPWSTRRSNESYIAATNGEVLPRLAMLDR